MLHRIILFTILIMGSFAFSQSTKALDEKNGFRHLKLGADMSEFNNLIELDYNDLINFNSFYYAHPDLEVVFGVKISGVSLSFYKNKLIVIMIFLGNPNENFTRDEFFSLKNAVSMHYGEAYTVKPTKISKGGIMHGAIWEGNNVTLELVRTEWLTDKSNPLSQDDGYITVYDKESKLNMYKDNL